MRNELFPWGLTTLANNCVNPFIWRPAIWETWVATRAPCVASVVICKCGNTNYHKTINTNADKNTVIYVVHPNVGLRPPSIGIGYLIVQLMEITVGSHSSLTYTASTGIHQIYSNVYYKLTIKCNLIHILNWSHWLQPTPVYGTWNPIHGWIVVTVSNNLHLDNN